MKEEVGKKLKSFLKKEKMSYPEFAEKVGVGRVTIWRLCELNRMVNRKVAYKIEAYTCGEIKAAEICKNID